MAFEEDAAVGKLLIPLRSAHICLMRKCKQCGAHIIGFKSTCSSCGSELSPTVGDVARFSANGCWRAVTGLFGVLLILGGLPFLFSPAFVGGIAMILVGAGFARDAIEG